MPLLGLPDEHIGSLSAPDHVERPLSSLDPVNRVFLAKLPPTPVGVLSADMRNSLMPTLPVRFVDAKNLKTMRHKKPRFYKWNRILHDSFHR